MPYGYDSQKNRLRRAALHRAQGGVCIYCRRQIGVQVGESGEPVLEHFRPRCMGGHAGNLVLACGWCDKKKGMMHGREFMALVRDHMVGGNLSDQARQAVAFRCKVRNRELAGAHLKAIAQKEASGAPDRL